MKQVMGTQPLNFLSLFAGIGGLDLGLERAGMRCIGQVEIDPYNRKVLAKHWPDVPRFNDVRTVSRETLDGISIDLIAGGFPCQDISTVGNMAGIDGKQSGLWGEFHRLICEIRPRYVLVENVSALLFRGIGRVLGDLAESRYDAEWECLPACSFGAPHHRDRVFIVGQVQHPESQRGRSAIRTIQGIRSDESRTRAAAWAACEPPMVGVADGVPGRVDRHYGLGNAVVPQVAEWIGRRIVDAAGAR